MSFDISTETGRVQIVDREPLEVLSTIAFASQYLLNAERRRRVRQALINNAEMVVLAAWAIVLVILGAS